MSSNQIRNLHPCFGAVGTKARVHLPLCPACNLECAFCRRSIGDGENRPGVASFVLPPEKAPEYVAAALAKCGELSVVGVAGPGDCLVGNALFTAFGLLNISHPELLKCVSTNGLLLEERADELIRVGLDTLTVTVNAVDPLLLSKIVPAIHHKGERRTGPEASMLLIKNQLSGIRKMAAAGTRIKVNMVLVPGLNDRHVPEVARFVKAAGASVFNIIPLIPQHLMTERRAPTCEEIESARVKAGKYIDVFRHCQRCRADAIGIPGVSEFAGELAWGQTEEVFSHG